MRALPAASGTTAGATFVAKRSASSIACLIATSWLSMLKKSGASGTTPGTAVVPVAMLILDDCSHAHDFYSAGFHQIQAA
jgi:hypothetical protein